MKSLYGIIIWFFESLPNVFEGQFVFVFFEAMYFEDVCVCVCVYTRVFICVIESSSIYLLVSSLRVLELEFVGFMVFVSLRVSGVEA
jgi:hypothetical protein